MRTKLKNVGKVREIRASARAWNSSSRSNRIRGKRHSQSQYSVILHYCVSKKYQRESLRRRRRNEKRGRRRYFTRETRISRARRRWWWLRRGGGWGLEKKDLGELIGHGN